MSNARDRAAALRARDVKPDPAEEIPEPRERPKRRKVRQTVDLTPEQHAALAAWLLDAAIQLDRPRVTTQDALSAAVAVLLEDDMVARRVRARLERGQ